MKNACKCDETRVRDGDGQWMDKPRRKGWGRGGRAGDGKRSSDLAASFPGVTKGVHLFEEDLVQNKHRAALDARPY